MRYIEITEPGDPSVLRISERPAPDCGVDEVLIKVSAAGVNRPDVIQRLGFYPPPPGASDIPGLEVSGIVEEVGSGVKNWSVGDSVCALANGGGYAEFVAVPAGQCLPIPDGLSHLEAASLPETFFTVWTNVFDRGRLIPGETLLVHGGSSGIGVAAIQMGVAMGAKVYVTAGSAEKCLACEALGATGAFNYRDGDWSEQLEFVLGDAGVDVVLDMVGGDYVQKNIDIANPDGRIVNIAYQAGSKVTVNLMSVMIKRLTMTGSTLRPQSAESKAAIAEGLAEHIWPKLVSGDITPVIHAVFALEEAAAAHRLMESGQHIGKILLSLEQE